MCMRPRDWDAGWFLKLCARLGGAGAAVGIVTIVRTVAMEQDRAGGTASWPRILELHGGLTATEASGLLATLLSLTKFSLHQRADARTGPILRVEGWARDERAKHLRAKRWRQENPERTRAARRRRRAAVAGASGSHTEAQWRARAAFYGWRCRYCGAELDASTATRDHVIPLSRGGSDWASNLVPACGPCNSRKGARRAAALETRRGSACG